MAHLYINYKGDPVTVHSYSSGSTFDECPQKYFLQKAKGYRRKGNKASLKFGICVEEGLMYYHRNGLKPGEGVDEFKRRFLALKDDTTLEYTAKEGSWSDLYRMGADMLLLYEALLPTFPIADPAWQANYKREVFPGTELAGLEHTAFLDMVSRSPWVHPMLPRLPIPKGSAFRPVLVDVKTGGTSLGDAAEMLSLDPQLREYAWTSGIETVGFLWFAKARPGSYDKSTEVSLLREHGLFKAGDKAVVVYVQKMDDEEYVAAYAAEQEALANPAPEEKKPKGKPKQPLTPPITEDAIGLVPPSLFYDFEQGTKDLRGKALEAFKIAFVAEWGCLVPPDKVTKVKIEFAATVVTPENMAEAGQNVGRQIVEIVNCSKTGVWPKRPSVRFPNMKCLMCEMRGLCLGKPDLVEKMLVQITPTAPAEPDWLDDLSSD